MPEILQRLNESMYTAWPFVEDSILSDSGIPKALPFSALIDCRLVVYGAARGRLRLDRIVVGAVPPTLATAVFVYEPEDGADITISIGAIPASDAAWTVMENYKTSVHLGTVSMYVAFGPGIRDFCSGEAGNTGTFTDLYLEPSCIRSADKHFVTRFDSLTGVQLTGDVKLMAGYNMDVSVFPATNTVKLSGRIGDGLGIPCEHVLPTPETNCGELVYFINGTGPDWLGEYKFMPGNGIEIVPWPLLHKVTLKTPYLACQPGCMDEGIMPEPAGSSVFTGGIARSSPALSAAAYAFDGDEASYWWGSDTPSAYIEYDLGAGNEKAVTRLRVMCDSDAYGLKDFRIYGRTGATYFFKADVVGENWTSKEYKEYVFASATPLRYWGLLITAVKSGPNSPKVYEIKGYE